MGLEWALCKEFFYIGKLDRLGVQLAVFNECGNDLPVRIIESDGKVGDPDKIQDFLY